MQPEIIKNYTFTVAGLQTTTTAATITQSTQQLDRDAERLNLEAQIQGKIKENVFVSLLWDWLPEGTFPLMVAVEVIPDTLQPEPCVTYQFPACSYASFPIEGSPPNYAEPWEDIFAWYPLEMAGFRATFRRYDYNTGKNEVLIPLVSNLRPITT